jgi:hypothetical protein
MSDPFSSIFQSYDDYEEGRQVNYETNVVRFVLKKIGKSREESELPSVGEQLRFIDFIAHFNFPVWCVVNKLRGLHKTANLSDVLYKHTTKTSVYKVWKEAVFDRDAYESHGIIFAWPGRGRYTILHNCPAPPLRGRGQYMYVNSEMLWVQDLVDFLYELGPCDEW